MGIKIEALVAWCTENGVNPRDESAREAYELAFPTKGKKAKKRRELHVRVMGTNEDGEDVVFTDPDGNKFTSCPNLKEKVSDLAGIMLFQAATIGGLTNCRIEKTYAPEWVPVDLDDD